MIVIILILLSVGVALFIMLSDTRRNNGFKKLERSGDDVMTADAADSGGDGGGGGD